jgi:hypothetical protein
MSFSNTHTNLRQTIASITKDVSIQHPTVISHSINIVADAVKQPSRYQTVQDEQTPLLQLKGRKSQGKSNMGSAAVMVDKVNREAMFYYMAMK